MSKKGSNPPPPKDVRPSPPPAPPTVIIHKKKDIMAKIYIDQELVKRLHAEGVSNNAIMIKHKIPGSCIVQILKGIDRPFYKTKTRKNLTADDICTCCKCRKKTGRFLCDYCKSKYAGSVGDDFGDGNRGYSSARKGMS